MNARQTLRIAILVGLAALLLVSPVAWAASAGSPAEQLKRSIDKAMKLLQEPEPDEKEQRAAIREIANTTFDFEETAKRSLAHHWRERTKREQAEFVQLFADLWALTGLSRIDRYGGEWIVYLDETLDGDRATVRTRVITRQGSEVPVDYRMHRRGDRWLIYDLLIGGVSLVGNYRSQLSKIIRKSSYEALIQKLKAQRARAREQETMARR